MDFHGVDLNLLAAFDALMDERNVTRAAARVNVSQPAMSAALSRLRVHFEDQLFLRSAEGLLPTPRARDLAGPVSKALRQLEVVLVNRPEFVPDQASLDFTIGLSDYPAFVLLPALVNALEKKAPGIALRVHSFSSRDCAVDLLDAGTIDAAVGVPPTHAENRILTRPILRDDFVTIVRREHPSARRGMSMKIFMSLSHVLVSPEGDSHGLVDEALAQVGKRRKLVLTMPQMFVAPMVVAQTDLTATVMNRVALNSSARRSLVLFPPPVALPQVVFDLIWHRRNEMHPAQIWLRGLVESLAKSL